MLAAKTTYYIPRRENWVLEGKLLRGVRFSGVEMVLRRWLACPVRKKTSQGIAGRHPQNSLFSRSRFAKAARTPKARDGKRQLRVRS